MATVIVNEVREHEGAAIGPVSRGDRGDDDFDLTIPTDQVYRDCELSDVDGQYRAGVRIAHQPAPGATGSQRVTVHWYFDGGPGRAHVRYRLRVVVATKAEVRPARKVPGFLPSTHGLHFVNLFSNVQVTLQLGGAWLTLPGANGGACGGMVFTVRDLFESGFLVHADTVAPDSGPLWEHIMARLEDSFGLPDGPQDYLELMNPTLAETSIPLRRGRGQILREAWARIREDIDRGVLSPLGLVLVKSADPRQLTNNHQVLAYGYTAHSDRAGTIFLYDPNDPDEDTAVLTFAIGGDDRVTSLQSSYPYPGLVGFFRSEYSHTTPPRPAVTTTTLVALEAPTGTYMVAEGGGGGAVRADRARIGPWEAFRMERTGRDSTRAPDLVALRAFDGRYVVAEGGGGGAVNADRDQQASWERFVLLARKGRGSVQDRESISLRTDRDLFLHEDGGEVRATIAAMGPPTDFTLLHLVGLYEHADHGGACAPLRPGRYDLADLGLPNDTVSSLRVPPCMRVTLFEHAGFQGETRVYLHDEPFVGDFNDRTSSVVVEQGVMVYADVRYQGAEAFFPVGDHALGGASFPARVLSSLRVPRGYRVRLYESASPSASSMEVLEDMPDVGAFHDRARSLRVEKLF